MNCYYAASTLVVVHVYNLGLGQFLVADVHSCHHGLGEIDESLPRDGIHVASRRLTFVTTLTDALHDGDLCQQRTAELLSQ